MAITRHHGLLAWGHLWRVYNKMQYHSLEYLDAFELTPAQFEVLVNLSVAPGISQQELSERLLVTKGNICGLIDRLEEPKKLVERRCHPSDRRSKLLFLTEAGRELADKVIPGHGQFIQEHMSALSDEDQRTLLALLRELDISLTRHQH